MSEVLWDAPNQQVVRGDQSAPWDEGTGGSTPPEPQPQEPPEPQPQEEPQPEQEPQPEPPPPPSPEPPPVQEPDDGGEG